MSTKETDPLARLTQSITIGGRDIHNRLCLSPMAGLTHVALRELIARLGHHGLLFMEMCSARAVPNENRRTSAVFRWQDTELPHLVCQLFGDAPEQMAMAAARVESEGFFGVDVNMGCAVAAICKQRCGADLLKDPERAVRIVAAIRKAVSIPLFVKFRTGWEDNPDHAIRLAKQFESAGADALTFHPRVAPDRRSRPPKWDYIRQVKNNVGIPVFGNGNVFSADDARKMLTETGCDGIAVGRIAVARPWVFREWLTGETPDTEIFPETAHTFLDLLAAQYEPTAVVKRFKKFAVYFAANFKFGHDIRRQLCRGETVESLRANINDIFSAPQEIALRPNMNMFTG